jgi:YHS domain-containing protein
MAATQPSPYALDGYCPVDLMNSQRWAAGDKQFGAVHRGQTFLFSSAQNQQTFLADPDRYAPALGGIDPILALENQQTVVGKRHHGVYYRDRIYLFSNEASLNRFNQNPGHYAEGVRQALLRQNASQLR